MGSRGGAEAPVARGLRIPHLWSRTVYSRRFKGRWVKKRLPPQGPGVGEWLNKLVDFKWGSIYGVNKGAIIRKVFNDMGN